MKALLRTTPAILIFSLLFFLAGYASSPAYAATCSEAGGVCRSGSASTGWCNENEEEVSATGCTSFGGFTSKCCVAKESTTPSPTTEGTCPSETSTMRDARQCSGICASGQCTADGQGVKRCCVVYSDPSPTACPNGSTLKGSASQCLQSCTGSCVNDNSGVARCCLQPGGTTGGGTNGGGTTTTEGGALPEKKDEIDLGFLKISTDPAEFAVQLLNFGIGLGTLLAVLFLIIGGFGVATSAGDPDKLEAAKKQITAAIAGLLFIVLAGLILRTIGGIIGIDITLFGI